MRILQLLTQTAGGPVDHAADVSVELAGRGHESHLAGPSSPALSRARESGAVVHEVSMTHKSDVRGAAALRRLVRALRPDVLHLQDRRAGLLGRLPGVAPAGTRVVYTLHGVPESMSHLVAGNVVVDPPGRWDRLFYVHAERWLARRTDSVVVVPSAPVAGYARDHVGLPADRLRVVPNGVDTDRFRPNDDHHTDPASGGAVPLRLVWLGLMGTVKRVPLLLEVVDAVPQVRLTLVGDGPQRVEVEREIERRALGERVRLTGTVDDPAPYLREADAFALPSGAENLPLALLQAMATGLPVVASRVGGIPDLVRDGVDGILVAADRPGELVGAVRVLATDPDRARAMGRSARQRVVDDFSVTRCVDRLLAAYDAGTER